MTKRKAPEEKQKAGRPTKYDPALNDQVRKLCLLGATDEELADFFEVAVTTIDNWKNEHPEFLGAMKSGKAKADAEVAASLYQRALGYSHDDVHASSYEGIVTLTPIVKHYPPDTAAAFIWLKNRQSKSWKDKQEVEHTASKDLIDALDARRKRARGGQ